MLRSFKIYTCINGTLGLHLSRAPWDPYPWVSSIQKESTSYQAGLRIGDCLLELNGQDVLGLKISEIAALLKNRWLNESSNHVVVVIWRNKCNINNNGENATVNDCTGSINEEDDDDEDEENNAHNINQQSLQKFATCLQHIAQLLECPVCLEVIKPPGWQCCNGHVLCNNCRSRSEKCPVCRVPLGPRGRCLLSDKLFTLLADSFPCDGVRSNKNSPKDRRKCSTEFHNQPKMAIVQKHQQQEKDEQHGVKKAKDFLFTSLRHRRRKISNSKMSHDDNVSEHQAGEMKEESKHPSKQKLTMFDTNTVDVVASSLKRNCGNRKSTPYCENEAISMAEQQAIEANVKGVAKTFHYNELQRQASTIQNCHCIACFKSDGVAIVNNVTTATSTTETVKLNKYILQIPSQRQLQESIVQQQQQNEEKFPSYQCPTGKLCCLNLNVMPNATCASASASASSGTILATNSNNEETTNTYKNTLLHEPMTNNNLSTRTSTTVTPPETNAVMHQTVLMTEQLQQLPQHQHNVNSYKFYRSLKNEWDILAHLTGDHKLPVNQYYAEYDQRILVQRLTQLQSITLLNLRTSEDNDAKVEKFFVACIPLQAPSTEKASEVAIFMYHINTTANVTEKITSNSTALNDEVSNFETIIGNPLTGIKWFGCAHPLTTPWSHIHEKQHFFRHNVRQTPFVAVSMDEAAVSSDDDDDAFVIIIKRKLEIKTN